MDSEEAVGFLKFFWMLGKPHERTGSNWPFEVFLSVETNQLRIWKITELGKNGKNSRNPMVDHRVPHMFPKKKSECPFRWPDFQLHPSA